MSADSYKACHAMWIIQAQCTILCVFDTNTTPLQLAIRGTKDEQESWSQRQLVPVHPGGRAFPHPRGIHPLFPCAQGLLEGPPDENEGLWYQYSHHVRKLLWICFVSEALPPVQRSWRLAVTLQIRSVESTPARERGLQLPHTAGFRVSRVNLTCP